MRSEDEHEEGEDNDVEHTEDDEQAEEEGTK
jgi:hypothetical protein